MLQHLKNRHMDISLYNDIIVSDTNITFIIWNLSGKMVGYQRYNPNGRKDRCNDPKRNKYFTYISKTDKRIELAVWGLQLLNPQKKRIYLLEGVFKACRFHNYGLNAFAVLGNDPKHLKSWLATLGYEIFSVCDGDKAGRKLAKYGEKSLMLPDGVYVDDMTEREFLVLLNNLGEYI